jgi:hypothetical protein
MLSGPCSIRTAASVTRQLYIIRQRLETALQRRAIYNYRLADAFSYDIRIHAR